MLASHRSESIAGVRRWTTGRDEDSGVVQQAGHAALDRRIGVQIPAPESLAEVLIAFVRPPLYGKSY
jgi:hypothetical protein